MTTQTIQLTVSPKYKTLFNIQVPAKQRMWIEDFLDQLWIDISLLKEMAYIKRMKKDITDHNYKVSSKLWRNIK